MDLFISFLICGVVLIAVTIYLRCSVRMCTSKVSMNGKVAIVTGANAGIGFYTAMNLAKRGARVILACRSEGRGTAARDTIVKITGNEEVVYRQLDLSSLKSVRKFAATIFETEDQLHVLVNNAGVYGFSDYTEDGIIEGMQVNYFGHFLLTRLLLPLLKKSQPSRIINLSSNLHFFGRFNPETCNTRGGGPFEPWFNYSNSKFCMLMFSMELARRLAGTGVVANAAHPGVIMTGIVTNDSFWSRFWFEAWCMMYNRTMEQGAQTIEHLAVAEECANVSGKYFVDCASRVMSWRASSRATAKQLWEYSDKLVGYREGEDLNVKRINKATV